MKPITKKIITIGVFLAVVAAITVTVIFLTQETPLTSVAYGIGFASADEYDSSIDGYEVGAFGTYEEFCGSKWADARLRNEGEALKDAYYTSRYFKDKKLVVFAFNREYANLNFEIVDEKCTDGRCDISAVVLYSVPRRAENKDENGNIIIQDGDQTYTVPPESKNCVGEQAVDHPKVNTTYFYFYETEDSLAKEYTFSIVGERFFGIASNIYARNSFEPVLIPGEETPVMFRFSSREEADVFVTGEPYVKRLASFLVMMNAFTTNGIDDHDVIVMRFTSSANIDSLQGGYLEGTELVLWEIEKKNTWKLSGRASFLVMLTVPKDADIETLRWVSYREKDAPEPHFEERTYSLVRDDGSAIAKYNTEILP